MKPIGSNKNNTSSSSLSSTIIDTANITVPVAESNNKGYIAGAYDWVAGKIWNAKDTVEEKIKQITEEHQKWTKDVVENMNAPPSPAILELLPRGGYKQKKTNDKKPNSTSDNLWYRERDGKRSFRAPWRFGPIEGIITAELIDNDNNITNTSKVGGNDDNNSENSIPTNLRIEIDSPSFPIHVRPLIVSD